jgi:hypothetical protein
MEKIKVLCTLIQEKSICLDNKKKQCFIQLVTFVSIIFLKINLNGKIYCANFILLKS